MRPLTACTLRGSYRWQRTTLSSEGLDIRNQDELFAKLPLGAFALEGELARSGRLSVRTMVSGQYLLEGSSAADVTDYGECAAATHLLTGVSIGSFKLHSGGTLDAGASVGSASVGGVYGSIPSDSANRTASGVGVAFWPGNRFASGLHSARKSRICASVSVLISGRWQGYGGGLLGARRQSWSVTRGGWNSTGTPSRVSSTSVSMLPTPRSRATSKPGRVFSGLSPRAPRCP